MEHDEDTVLAGFPIEPRDNETGAGPSPTGRAERGRAFRTGIAGAADVGRKDYLDVGLNATFIPDGSGAWMLDSIGEPGGGPRYEFGFGSPGRRYPALDSATPPTRPTRTR